jgi:multimeric flavodoxin WrbA
MTDLIKNEVITNKKGDHYRFVSVENTEEEAQHLCKELVKAGFQAATFQRNDNHLFEVFSKFTKAEEINFILERKHCDKCTRDKKTECHVKSCVVKEDIEDTLWKERLNFYSLLDFKLKKLRLENQPKPE